MNSNILTKFSKKAFYFFPITPKSSAYVDMGDIEVGFGMETRWNGRNTYNEKIDG